MPIELENHPTIEIAEALETLLPALDWPESLGTIEWKLVAVPELALTELQSAIQVLICPNGITSSPSARRSTNEMPVVDVCVRANCGPLDTERLWLLMSFMFSIGREVLAKHSVADWTPMSIENKPIYDVDTLRKLNEFRGNQSIQFRGLLEHS